MADFFDSLSSDSFILPGIGTATNRPYEAPIIKGLTGRVEAPVNPNDGSMGVVMRRSMISSYTRTTEFDGSRYGIDLSDFYAFRLNFIPIKDETLEDLRGSLKVYFRDQIAVGAVDTWQDLTGSMSREWDFTKDIVTGSGANLVDFIQNFDSAGSVNQDIVFIRKSLLDIADYTGNTVTPKILLFQGATQISSLGEDLKDLESLECKFYNAWIYKEIANQSYNINIGEKVIEIPKFETLFNKSYFNTKSEAIFEKSELALILNINAPIFSTKAVKMFDYWGFTDSDCYIDDISGYFMIDSDDQGYETSFMKANVQDFRRTGTGLGYNFRLMGGSNTSMGPTPYITKIVIKVKLILENQSNNPFMWYRFGRIDNLPTI